MSLHAHICACVWRFEVEFWYLPPIALHICFFRQSASLNLKLIYCARLSDRRPQGNCLFSQPPPRDWVYKNLPSRLAFYMGSWDLNLGPPICVAGKLLTEPFSQHGKAHQNFTLNGVEFKYPCIVNGSCVDTDQDLSRKEHNYI